MIGNGWHKQSDSDIQAGESTATRLGDLVAEQASRTFAGRKQELALLLEMLGNSGPAIVYLHGIAGIGKSRLIAAFAERARNQNASVIILDCRAVEPTEQGFLRAIGSRFGTNFAAVEETVRTLGDLGPRIVRARPL